MADWIGQYTMALDVRDKREGAHRVYVDAYTKLADRTAALESNATTSSQTQAQNPPPNPPGPSPTPTKGAKTKHQPANRDISPATQQNSPQDLLSRLRADLATTQRSRAELQTQLTRLTADMSALTAQSTASGQRIAALEREKRDLDRRLRDRDEELRGKSRLVESVQDEMVGLNLQLNMAEQRADRLKGENDDLVKRWMQRMGEEAERMNVESKWA